MVVEFLEHLKMLHHTDEWVNTYVFDDILEQKVMHDDDIPDVVVYEYLKKYRLPPNPSGDGKVYDEYINTKTKVCAWMLNPNRNANKSMYQLRDIHYDDDMGVLNANWVRTGVVEKCKKLCLRHYYRNEYNAYADAKHLPFVCMESYKCVKCRERIRYNPFVSTVVSNSPRCSTCVKASK
jgi:hypothetical protein